MGFDIYESICAMSPASRQNDACHSFPKRGCRRRKQHIRSRSGEMNFRSSAEHNAILVKVQMMIGGGKVDGAPFQDLAGLRFSNTNLSRAIGRYLRYLRRTRDFDG